MMARRANRKALEDQAGKNAAKLMLRSVPDKSSVRIDGKPVGKTPLLLIVQPGVYVVEMEGGPRMVWPPTSRPSSQGGARSRA